MYNTQPLRVEVEEMLYSTHYRAGDTTSGAADEPHLARDVTY